MEGCPNYGCYKLRKIAFFTLSYELNSEQRLCLRAEQTESVCPF